MPQIFHPSMNTISRVSVFGAVFLVAAAIGIMAVVVRSPYVTEAGVIRVQPVPFSHKHHVQDAGIDCRYCHSSVEESAFAGMPSTAVCMGCHSQLWADSPMLEPVRESYRTGEPLKWTRVHDVPDFVYFDHSIHVHKGIGCAECHGRVDQMPLMWREETLHMEWCLECHRNPERYVRPRREVFNMRWRRSGESVSTGRVSADASSAPAAGASSSHQSPSDSPSAQNSSAQNSPAQETSGQQSPPRESTAVEPPASELPQRHMSPNELIDEYHIQSKTNCSVCHR